MKKYVSIVLALIMVLTLFTACGETADKPENTGDGDQITLELFHRYATDEQVAFMEKVIALFEEENPNINVEVSTSGRDEYRDKLKVVLGSNDIPDVFFSYAYENVNEIIREGKCMPITEYFNADEEWKNSYANGVLDGYTYEGELYGAPYRVSISVILYNKDLFAKAGVEAPKTMDDLYACCEALKAAGIQPFAFGNSEKWPAPQWIGAFNQKTVDPAVMANDYAMKGDFTDAGYLQSFDIWAKLLSYANQDANATNYSMTEEALAAGNAAMIWGESVSVGDVLSLNKDLNLGVFAIPSVTDGKGDNACVQGGPEGFVVSADTEYPEEACKLVKFLSSPEVGKMMMESDLQWFNGAKDVIDTSAADLSPVGEAYKILNESAGLNAFLDTAMNSSVADVYIAGLQSFIDGSMTAEDVMQAVRDEAALVAAE